MEENFGEREEVSADDIFGGQEINNSEEISEEEIKEEVILDDPENIKSEDEVLDSEPESVVEKDETEEKKSDNTQKSFFDTFDEN